MVLNLFIITLQYLDGDLIEIYNSSNNQILDFLFLEGQPFNVKNFFKKI